MMGAGYLLEMLRNSGENQSVKKSPKNSTKSSTPQPKDIPESSESIIVDSVSIIQETASVNLVLENQSTESTEEKAAIPADHHIGIDYNFDSPRLLLRETASFSTNGRYTNNFLKGCKWSPDGSCLLTNSEDRKLRLFTLPSEYYERDFFAESSSEDSLRIDEQLNLLSTVSAGELVYDYSWYPLMNSSTAESCVYVHSSRDHPIHLCDALSGNLCATYSPINHLDEVACAYSLAFSPDGSRLYAGFNKTIRVFDTYRPGRQILTKATWKKRQGGQTGIISCIAACPTMPSLFACGSYSKTVATYSDTFEDGPLSTMQAKGMGGVTHLLFHPNGHYLFSGGRMDSEIVCWDTRMPGQIFAIYERDAGTNQRFYFDLDRCGQYLISGSSKGEIRIWDTRNLPQDDGYVKPSSTFQAHQSAANGISLNSYLPLLATSGGQRVVSLPLSESDDENNSDADDNALQPDGFEMDNSVKLWLIGRIPENDE